MGTQLIDLYLPSPEALAIPAFSPTHATSRQTLHPMLHRPPRIEPRPSRPYPFSMQILAMHFIDSMQPHTRVFARFGSARRYIANARYVFALPPMFGIC